MTRIDVKSGYKGRRMTSKPSGSTRSRAEILQSPQIGAQTLLACYVAASVFSMTGFFVSFNLISEDLKNRNAVDQGSGLVIGAMVGIITMIIAGLLITLSRRLWAAVKDKKITAIRRFSLFSGVGATSGLVLLIFNFGRDVLATLAPGGLAVFLILFALSSVLTFAANRPTKY